MTFQTMIQPTLDWLQFYYAHILFGVFLLLVIFRKQVTEFFGKFKKKKEQPIEDTPQMIISKLFTNELVMPNLPEQKRVIEDDLKNIVNEGRQLIQEEKEVNFEYKSKKELIAFKNRQLTVRYTMQTRQLESINQMISNQAKLDEMLNPQPKE